MSIRAPTICSLCNWYGHNRRRCHIVINDEEQRERRRQDNFEINIDVEHWEREQHQQHQSQLRRSFALTQEDVLTFIFNQGNGYKNLLTKPEELKAPHSGVYVSESCPICMEAIGKTNVTTMLCGHQTCTGCFARNIIESQSNCCPVCREKVI
jgi:hypothetical protein